MATYYVYSGATGGGTGADWANAYTTVTLATASGKFAGDIFYVAHDHLESTGAAITLSIGTTANPCQFICVNRAGSVPPVQADLATTGIIRTTGAFSITITAVLYVYGIKFQPSNGGTGTNGVALNTSRGWYKKCTFDLQSTGAALVSGNSTGGLIEFEDCTLIVNNTTSKFDLSSPMLIKNCPNLISGATIPVNIAGANMIEATLEGCDLSPMGAGCQIFATPVSTYARRVMKNCKLNASATISATPSNGGRVSVISCDSGDTNYRQEQYNYTGTLTTETTIVHTGGATDGTTPIAWKLVTGANTKWVNPHECFPITVWNESIGSAKTVTVDGIWGGGATPLTDEIWIEVEYFGTSGFPVSSRATSTKNGPMGTGSNLPAGTGTWGGSTTKFAMAATFTPQEKGPFTIVVKSGKASSTFYIDPKPVIT